MRVSSGLWRMPNNGFSSIDPAAEVGDVQRGQTENSRISSSQYSKIERYSAG